MIDALDMEYVAWDAQPHSSHDFGPKESTMVAGDGIDRFGSVRECKKCGGREVWAGGAGSHYFDADLLRKCQS